MAVLRVDHPDGSIANQKSFKIPAEPDYLAMMVNRTDHSLGNAAPVKQWGGGKLSLGGEVFKEGDELRIVFTTEVDCYVTIFNIVEDGTVTMLLPNRFRRDNFIKSGTNLVFPGNSEKEKGFRY